MEGANAAPHLVEEQLRLGAEVPEALMAGERGPVHRSLLLGQRSGFGRVRVGLVVLIRHRGGSGRPPCFGGLVLDGGGSVGQFRLETVVRLLDRDILDSLVNRLRP